MPHMKADDRLKAMHSPDSIARMKALREAEGDDILAALESARNPRFITAHEEYQHYLKPGIQNLPAPKKDKRWYGGRSLIAAVSMILSGLVMIGMFVLAVRYGVIS